MNWRVTLGCCAMKSRKVSLEMRTRRESRSAVTVAVRMPPLSTLISPISSPRPISPRRSTRPASSSRVATSRPLITMYNASEVSPRRSKAVPPATLTCSKSAPTLCTNAGSRSG